MPREDNGNVWSERGLDECQGACTGPWVLLTAQKQRQKTKTFITMLYLSEFSKVSLLVSQERLVIWDGWRKRESGRWATGTEESQVLLPVILVSLELHTQLRAEWEGKSPHKWQAKNQNHIQRGWRLFISSPMYRVCVCWKLNAITKES